MAYKIKNITSNIRVEKTIMEIEQILSQCGAEAVLKEYQGGLPVALSFIITYNAKKIPIRLPLEIEPSREIIEEAIREKKLSKKYRQEPLRTEKALMVGWRVMKDWIHSQLSLLSMKYANPLKIFLPYIYDPTRKITFYDQLEKQEFKALKFIEEEKKEEA